LFLDRFDFPAGIALNLAKAGRLQVVIDVPVGKESGPFLVPKYVQSEHRVKRVIIVDLRGVSDPELDRDFCSRRAGLRCFNPFRSEIIPGAPVSPLSKTYKMTAASARDIQDLPDPAGRVGPKCELQKFKLARSLTVSALALGE